MLATVLQSAKHRTAGGNIVLVQVQRTSREGEISATVDKQPVSYKIVALSGTHVLKVGAHFYASFDQEGLNEEEIRNGSESSFRIRVYDSVTDLRQAEELLKNYCGMSDVVEVP